MGSKHDALIDIIARELKLRGYTQIYKNIEYKNKGKEGEIDLYAEHNHYRLLFEVKTNYNYKSYCKAIRQLTRAEKYYFNTNHRVFKFYVCNIRDPIIKWVK
jgi:Holliday junction resolvase-like predicted endonuclease